MSDGDVLPLGQPFRVIPHSLEAEVCVLGSMMLDEACIDLVVQIIRPEQLYRPAHQLIFRALVEMRNTNKPIDLVLVRDELVHRQQMEQAGGVDYLVELVEGVPTAANVEYYARIVHDKAILRDLIRAGTDIVNEAFAPQTETQEAVEEAQKRVLAIASEHVQHEAVFVKDLLSQAFESLEKHDGSLTGLATGYYQLDELTRGLQNGELIILAARPSMGKTSLLLNMIEHMAIVEKKEVAIFSLEMSKEQLAMRFLASHAKFSLRRVRQGMIPAEDWTRLQMAAGDLEQASILIDDSPDVTIGRLRAQARRLQALHGIKCIFIDYLQLMRFHGRSENRQAEVAEMSRGLKALARELAIPVVTAAQLNRKPADRPSHRPQMSDLRESGSIEQDADVVMLLHNEDYYHEGEEGYQPSSITELIVAKQRNGPTGLVPLVFLKEFTRFESSAATF